MRERARELGLSDSEVARRIGITQRRYSSYVNATREPNFADLLRVCKALAITPDHVLGLTQPEPGDDAERRALLALRSMTLEGRRLAVAAVEGMATVATTKGVSVQHD